MRSRIELDEVLRKITPNVYFDPPEDEYMDYPCIRYSLGGFDNTYANDKVYQQKRAYKLVAIDEDPDSNIPILISRLEGCKKESTHYVTDGLHHDTFTLYF